MQPTAQAPEVNARASKSDGHAGRYFTFVIGNEECGIALLKVREIVGVQCITAVPQTPSYLKGVINSRSKVMPAAERAVACCAQHRRGEF